MSDGLNESNIVRAVAEGAARRMTRKVITTLQHMNHTLSGEDSELKTAWDEICVQVQCEDSVFREAYDETVRTIVAGYVTEIPKYEREALWLQTDAGSDWSWEKPEDREAYPVCNDDIVNYLTREYVYAEADRWSNERIRAFSDRTT